MTEVKNCEGCMYLDRTAKGKGYCSIVDSYEGDPEQRKKYASPKCREPDMERCRRYCEGDFATRTKTYKSLMKLTEEERRQDTRWCGTCMYRPEDMAGEHCRSCSLDDHTNWVRYERPAWCAKYEI